MKRRTKVFIGAGLTLALAGAAAESQWGSDEPATASRPEATPTVTASSPNVQPAAEPSRTVSAAGATACTGLWGEVLKGSGEYTEVRIHPIIQPETSGKVGVRVESTPIDPSGGLVTDYTETFPQSGFSPDAVDVDFASQAALLKATVSVEGAGELSCPPKVGELDRGEDSSALVFTMSQPPSAGPIPLHTS